MGLALGAKTYGELKRFTKLSDRWLSIKLKELTAAGAIELRDNKYTLANPDIVRRDRLAFECFKAWASPLAKAKLIADELSRDGRVLIVLLFGSVAKGRAVAESDLDLIVVTDGGIELNDEVYELAFKYDIPIEAIFMSFEGLLSHARERTTFFLGVLEGYEVLYDRIGIGGVLSFLKAETERKFAYDEEAGAWIQKSAPPTSTPP